MNRRGKGEKKEEIIIKKKISKCRTLSNAVPLSPKSIFQTAKRMMNLTVFFVQIEGNLLRKKLETAISFFFF